MTYDTNNIFAKIIRGEITCEKLIDNDHVIAFRDLYPKAKIHVLVCPKGPYTSMAEFSARASDAEIVALTRAVGQVAHDLGIDETGFRIASNAGPDSHQEVPHLHIHLVGGEPLGPMWQKR